MEYLITTTLVSFSPFRAIMVSLTTSSSCVGLVVNCLTRTRDMNTQERPEYMYLFEEGIRLNGDGQINSVRTSPHGEKLRTRHWPDLLELRFGTSITTVSHAGYHATSI